MKAGFKHSFPTSSPLLPLDTSEGDGWALLACLCARLPGGFPSPCSLSPRPRRSDDVGPAGPACASRPGRCASLSVEGGVGSGSSRASGSAMASCPVIEGARGRLREAGPGASFVPSCPHPTPHSQTLCGLNLALWQRGLEMTLEDESPLPSLPNSLPGH